METRKLKIATWKSGSRAGLDGRNERWLRSGKRQKE